MLGYSFSQHKYVENLILRKICSQVYKFPLQKSVNLDSLSALEFNWLPTLHIGCKYYIIVI
jgi:hypothetical protein